MSKIELKPCPFCGGKAEIERLGDNRQSTIISCTECGCILENGEAFRHGEAWNTRAADATIARLEAENARMRSLLSVADAQIVGIYSAATPGGNYEFGNRFADNDPVVKEIRSVLTVPNPDDGTPREASE
jgi:Lar family restriction alleviation protein